MPLRAWVALLVVATGLVFAASAAEADQLSAQISNDQFSTGATVNGAAHTVNDNANAVSYVWQMRSFIDRTSQVVKQYQLYIDFTYTGESFGRVQVIDDTAHALNTKVLDQTSCAFNSCPKDLVLGVEIDEGMLHQRADQGFRVKVQARSGYTTIIQITPEAIIDQFVAAYKFRGIAANVQDQEQTLSVPSQQEIDGARQAGAKRERVQRVAYRLAVAATDICPSPLVMTIGATLTSLSAVPENARSFFIAINPWLSDEITVMNVFPGSPAELQKLPVGAALLAIDDKSLATNVNTPSDAAKLIHDAKGPFKITARRGGITATAVVSPIKECPIAFDLSNAATTGVTRTAQGYMVHNGLVAFLASDDDLAIVEATEVAHSFGKAGDSIDETALTLATRAGYRIAGAAGLWSRLAGAKALLVEDYPVTAERMTAVGNLVASLSTTSAGAHVQPPDPSAH